MHAQRIKDYEPTLALSERDERKFHRFFSGALSFFFAKEGKFLSNLKRARIHSKEHATKSSQLTDDGWD